MLIEKPDLLGFTSQALQWGETLYQSCTATVCVSLADGSLQPPDASMAAIVKALGNGTCPDGGAPKGRAEWLLAGSIYAPTGQKADGLAASVRVGSSTRTFIAKSSRPFESVELSWKNTCLNEQDNPDGYPQGKRPDTYVTDPDQSETVPACPSVQGAWPCRMKYLGTYDAAWVKQGWPGLARDCDPLFFNLAQSRQFIDGGLKGDEAIELVNLHPIHRRITTALPGRTVSMDVFKKDADIKQQKLVLDTVWLLPDQMVLIEFWHGLVPSTTETGADIDKLVLHVIPEDEKKTEAQAPEVPKAPAAPEAAAAGIAGGAAGDGAEAEESSSEASAGIPDLMASEANDAITASGPEPDPGFMEGPMTATSMEAEICSELDASLDEINAALVDAGYKPLDASGVEEARGFISKYANMMEEISKKAELPMPSFEEQLASVGCSDEQIKAVKKAMDFELPDPHAFTEADVWGKAVDKAVDEFASIISLPEDQAKSMKTVMMASGPGGEKILSDMAGNPPTEPLSILIEKAGMSRESAAKFIEALDTDLPESIDDLESYAHMVEKAAGFPENSMSKYIAGYTKFIKENNLLDGEETAIGDALAGADELAATAGDAASAGTANAAAAAIDESAVKAADGAQAAAAAGGALGGAALKTDEDKGFRFDGVIEVADPLSDSEEAPASLDPSLFDENGLPAENAVRAVLSKADGTRTRDDVILLRLAGAPLAGLSLTKISLRGLDFSCQDMSGCDFSFCDLTGSRFDDANLSGAKLDGANLADVSLSRADLTGSSLNNAVATKADFTAAKLTNASASGIMAPDSSWEKADLTGAVFTKARLEGADLAEIMGSKLDLTGASLAGSHLRAASLIGATLKDSSCPGADFHGTDVTNADFTRADLSRAAFGFGAKADGATFAKANLSEGVWTNTSAIGADFSFVAARNATFTDSAFSQSRWPLADVREADFSRSDLTAADLRKADLFNGSAREAVFASADMQDSSLYGADLTHAHANAATNTQGADITNTIWAVRGGCPNA